MMASSSSARSKPGLCLIEDEYWYTGPLSERKAEVILTKLNEPGSFLVRDSLLPEADYVLSVNSGKEIWHYDVKVLPNNECIFNKYTFTSLPDAVMFYTENRLGSVFLKEPEEPVVTETQLKSFGPKLVKSAAPESVKPPRTSPFASAETSTKATVSASPQMSGFTATDTHPSSSPQTRKLVAPESLRRPQTPPAERHHTSSPQSRRLVAPESLRQSRTPTTVRATEKYQTSSPQSRKIGVPDSIKSPYRAPLDGYAPASPLIYHRETEYDREVENDATVNSHPINALPRSSALAGDGWLDSHSRTGSQVSIGSHSPKPQSVQHFVVDLEDSGVPSRSQSQSQKSEVDCSYIVPSNEVESVFVTTGQSIYMYVAPQSPDFIKTSPSEKSSEDQQTLQGEQGPKSGREEAGRKAEICETEFDSSTAPTTAILNLPSSAETTPVQQTNKPNTVVRQVRGENLDWNEKDDATQSRKDSSGSNSDDAFSGQPVDTNQHQSVVERRRAFERQIQVKEDDKKTPPATVKPAKLPPIIPKRISSMNSVDKVPQGSTEEENGADSVKSLTRTSLASLHDKFEESNRPPPPPMSTHPGLTNKVQVEKPDDQLVVQDEKEVELSEVSSHVRPKPKGKRTSIPLIKPEMDQESSSEPVTKSVIIESSEPTSEVTPHILLASKVYPKSDESVSGVQAPPQKDKDLEDSKNKSRDTEANDKQQNADTLEEATDGFFEDESPSNSTFGHGICPSASPFLVGNGFEWPLNAERQLNAIDPSKKLGAEVSTFKPVPKPRSFQRHSMYGGSTTPTILEQPPYSSLSSPPQGASIAPTASLLAPPKTAYSYTPEMKRNSKNFASAANKREILLRAQSMSILPTTGSASPRMRERGEQRSQMPPGFVVFSRSQEAVIGRHATMSSNMMRRAIKMHGTESESGGDKQASAPTQAATAPMNTKRSIKKRRSFFRRK